MRPHQRCCLPDAEKTYCSAALISSPRAAFFLLHHAHQHAHRPLGAQLFGILQVSIGYCFLPFGASFEVYGLCFLFTNLTFPLPRSVFIVSRHSGYFIKGIASQSCRANFGQKPIALCRRFVRVVWNPRSFLIAITLIVSVTAPRRVPRTGKMPLLIPLDSPLSKDLAFAICSEKFLSGVARACEIGLSALGVCPFLFCDLIISSILHNVKRFLHSFSLHNALNIPTIFVVFYSFL